MRLTEAASSDPAGLAPRQQAAVVSAPETGAVPRPRGSDGATGQFASVLSATRRSSSRLLDLLKARSQARQDAVDQQERRDKGRAARRVDEGQKKTGGRERTDRPQRSEQLRSATRDRAEAAEPVEKPREESDRDIEQAVAGPQAAKPSAEPHAETPPSGDVVSVPTPLSPAASQTEAAKNLDSVLTGGAAAPPSSAAPGMAATLTGTSAASAPAVQTGSPAGTPEAIGPVSSAGTATGVEKTTGGKPAEGAAPATGSSKGGADGEFKSLLQHLARTRMGDAAVSARSFAKTAAAASGAEKPLDMESPETVHELARVVRSRIGPRQSSMTMLMSPAELGRLRIDVRMEDATLTVRFQAETAAGHDAIRGRLEELRGALEQQGIRIDRIEVEYLPPAPPLSPESQDHGQPPADHGQSQIPAEYGESAGQARHSFDPPRHEASGPSAAEGEADAGEPVLDTNVTWNWLRPGVDLVA